MNPAISMCLFDRCACIGRALLLPWRRELPARLLLAAFLAVGFCLLPAAGREPTPLFQISLDELLQSEPAELAIPPAHEPTINHWKMGLLELPVLVVPLLLLFFHPAFRRRWRELHGALRFVIAAFFACTIWFQATTFLQFDYPHRNEPFPFSRWSMFKGSRTDKRTIVLTDFSLETATGRQTVVAPPDLIETPPVSVQHTKVMMLTRMLTGKDPRRANFARHDLGYFCEGLARSHEDETEETVTRVNIWQRTVPWGTPLSEIPDRGDRSKSTLLFTLDRKGGERL